MIKFRNNKDNPDYLMWNVRVDGGQLVISEILPTYVQNEIEQMYFSSFEYEKNINTRISFRDHIGDIAFPKASLLGQWLLSNYNQKKIVYEDEFVYYTKVINSLNVAMFQDNPISERIIPLFKKKINGPKRDLMKEYDEEVLDYVLTHDDFEAWISEEKKEPTEYFVFEDGEYSKKALVPAKKVLAKTDENKPL